MPTMEPLSAWSRALRDPSLRDLPYKIETNERGQLVMSPLKVKHGVFQVRIADLLGELTLQAGVRSVEFAIETRLGIKVPDVIWISLSRYESIPEDAEASLVAPELCIEVLSRSNTRTEIDEKRQLYFDYGAVEMWTCDMEGRIRFYDPSGERQSSSLVPAFPRRIEI